MLSAWQVMMIISVCCYQVVASAPEPYPPSPPVDPPLISPPDPDGNPEQSPPAEKTVPTSSTPQDEGQN